MDRRRSSGRMGEERDRHEQRVAGETTTGQASESEREKRGSVTHCVRKKGEARDREEKTGSLSSSFDPS